jgi:hypothetical protein
MYLYIMSGPPLRIKRPNIERVNIFAVKKTFLCNPYVISHIRQQFFCLRKWEEIVGHLSEKPEGKRPFG